jgi:hypothetical protein
MILPTQFDPSVLDVLRDTRPSIVPYSEENVQYVLKNEKWTQEKSGYPSGTLCLPRVRNLLNREMEARILDCDKNEKNMVHDHEVRASYADSLSNDARYECRMAPNGMYTKKKYANYAEAYTEAVAPVLERRRLLGCVEDVSIDIEFNSIEEFHPENIDLKIKAALGRRPDVMAVLQSVPGTLKTSDAAMMLVNDTIYFRDNVTKSANAITANHPLVIFLRERITSVIVNISMRDSETSRFRACKDCTLHFIYLLVERVNPKDAALTLLSIVLSNDWDGVGDNTTRDRVANSIDKAAQDESTFVASSSRHKRSDVSNMRVSLKISVVGYDEEPCVKCDITYASVSDLENAGILNDGKYTR